MSTLYFCKQVVTNQMLGIGVTRRLLNALSARPQLAPSRPSGDIWSDPFHPELPLRKFRTILSLIGNTAYCRGKTVLEIGPGMSLGMGIVGVAWGAGRCVLVDQERYVGRDPRLATSHRELLHLIPSWIPDPDPRYRDCVEIGPDTVRPNEDLLDYVIASAEDIPVSEDTVDLSISHSTLEHIRDLDATIAELARLTKSGGIGVHQVDLADHLDPGRPLRMLGYTASSWELMASHRRGWTNRLRLPDYLHCLEQHHFIVERVEITRSLSPDELENIRHQLHPDYRQLPDEALRPLGFRCVFRKL